MPLTHSLTLAVFSVALVNQIASASFTDAAAATTTTAAASTDGKMSTMVMLMLMMALVMASSHPLFHLVALYKRPQALSLFSRFFLLRHCYAVGGGGVSMALLIIIPKVRGLLRVILVLSFLRLLSSLSLSLSLSFFLFFLSLFLMAALNTLITRENTNAVV